MSQSHHPGAGGEPSGVHCLGPLGSNGSPRGVTRRAGAEPAEEGERSGEESHRIWAKLNPQNPAGPRFRGFMDLR